MTMETIRINFLNRIVIIDTNKNKNSLGDLQLTVKVQVRGQKCEVVAVKEFIDYQPEGNHSEAYKTIENQIHSWGKMIGASFSGKVC